MDDFVNKIAGNQGMSATTPSGIKYSIQIPSFLKNMSVQQAQAEVLSHLGNTIQQSTSLLNQSIPPGYSGPQPDIKKAITIWKSPKGGDQNFPPTPPIPNPPPPIQKFPIQWYPDPSQPPTIPPPKFPIQYPPANPRGWNPTAGQIPPPGKPI